MIKLLIFIITAIILFIFEDYIAGKILSAFITNFDTLRELPCAKSTGRLNDFIIQTTLAV